MSHTSSNNNATGGMVRSHVYVFGSGDCGQLGLGEDTDVLPKPKLHPFFEGRQIVAIAAGGLHSLALSSTGQVRMTGRDVPSLKFFHSSIV